MYWKKVPDDFNICEYGIEWRGGDLRFGIGVGNLIEHLHQTYHYSLKSLKEKIIREWEEDNATKWYTARASEIFLSPREHKTFPKWHGFWISHYFKRKEK